MGVAWRVNEWGSYIQILRDVGRVEKQRKSKECKSNRETRENFPGNRGGSEIKFKWANARTSSGSFSQYRVRPRCWKREDP